MMYIMIMIAALVDVTVTSAINIPPNQTLESVKLLSRIGQPWSRVLRETSVTLSNDDQAVHTRPVWFDVKSAALLEFAALRREPRNTQTAQMQKHKRIKHNMIGIRFGKNKIVFRSVMNLGSASGLRRFFRSVENTTTLNTVQKVIVSRRADHIHAETTPLSLRLSNTFSSMLSKTTRYSGSMLSKTTRYSGRIDTGIPIRDYALPSSRPSLSQFMKESLESVRSSRPDGSRPTTHPILNTTDYLVLSLGSEVSTNNRRAKGHLKEDLVSTAGEIELKRNERKKFSDNEETSYFRPTEGTYMTETVPAVSTTFVKSLSAHISTTQSSRFALNEYGIEKHQSAETPNLVLTSATHWFNTDDNQKQGEIERLSSATASFTAFSSVISFAQNKPASPESSTFVLLKELGYTRNLDTFPAQVTPLFAYTGQVHKRGRWTTTPTFSGARGPPTSRIITFVSVLLVLVILAISVFLVVKFFYTQRGAHVFERICSACGGSSLVASSSVPH